MDYWLLGDNENNIIAHSDSNYHSKDLKDEPMIQHDPMLYCSFRNTDENNSRTFGRIFPKDKLENVLDERHCNVGLCHTDLRKEKFCNSVTKNQFVKDASDKAEFVPFVEKAPQIKLSSGLSEFKKYAASIDVESRLKRIDFNDNLCYVKDYKPNSDLLSHYEIIKKDYRIPVRIIGAYECGNFQELQHDDETLFHNVTKRKISGKTTNECDNNE